MPRLAPIQPECANRGLDAPAGDDRIGLGGIEIGIEAATCGDQQVARLVVEYVPVALEEAWIG